MADIQEVIPGVPPTPGAVAPLPAATTVAPPQAPAPVAAPVQVYVPSTGDALIDTAVSAFSKAYGVSPAVFETAIAPALDSGDLSKLNQVQLVQAIGAEGAAAALQLYNALSGRIKEQRSTAASTVHSLAGSPENWRVAVQNFNSTQPEFVKSQYAAMLDSGDPAQIQYAAKQVLDAARTAGLIAGALPVAPGNGVPVGQVGLSQEEFQAQLSKLRAEFPNRSFDTGEPRRRYDALLQQRTAGKRLGK